MLNFLMTTFNFAGKMSDMKLERRLLRKQQTLDSALGKNIVNFKFDLKINYFAENIKYYQ